MPVSPYRGTFHFVNKDASNLNKRDAEEAFSISSHVTNKYYRWAKNHRHVGGSRDPSLSRISKVVGFADACPDSRDADNDSYAGSFNEEVSVRMICWQLGSGTNPSTRGSASPPGSPESTDQMNSDSEGDNPYFRPELWPSRMMREESPMTPKNADWDAPDWAACPHFQKEALQIFRGFFLSFSSLNTASNASRQSIELGWRNSASNLVSDKKCLHGWYASVLTLKAHFMQPECYNFLYPMALKHQNRSLMLLREHIRQDLRPSESLIMCIWCIANIAFYTGDLEANVAHSSALWEIVDGLGGMEKLSPETRAQVILADNGHSRFTLTRPRLDYALFDPGSFQQQPEFEHYDSLLAETEFQRWDETFLLPEDEISENLENYVNMHREFMAAHTLISRVICERNGEHSVDAIFSWLHRRRAALSSWTMSLYCDIVETITPRTRISRAVRRQLQACLCLAVSYAMSFVYGFTLPLQKWLLYIPVQHLRPQIEILLSYMAKRGTLPSTRVAPSSKSTIPPPPSALSHHEPLLFLFFVGACAEQVSDEAGKRPQLLVDPKWHSTRFCEMSRILGLRTWKEAQRILKRFVYGDGTVMDRFVEGLFEQRNELGRGESVLG
ncbi:uncharacterized protein Z520_03387 [Fonsecaea multimorphosa CBS 102226]|uniref:Transcription factor domain-containing protein n=1 Tax=Fonsecaea multimorphosa CBS 102226 TaxID=1442371 RepID=A0A0D2IUI7_9EURO|nr:uncharacterized protein Z520_03387 [Fonsecaea multimorphosa CBS 102226]KIY00722.1 hypothetical protein Z520_03387 [Fonsecaea multimorphosa CBS 102226]OAL27766.1 hypothetical protein AYO22_03308 [Fonsecaea multimorphosa]